ncbi:MAG: hypothetical protein GY896_16005 [Gammaproteobacteria bacterium]|nr:hypothetical protein [Gammaproteobacteria bacterium]MCP4981447.1 hypothetical protein [Gammaproteobacteria bacterium]
MNNKSDEQNHPLSDSKTSDRSMILLLVGCLLLTPPLAGIFQLDIRILGIPFTGFYLFTVWAGLIAGAAVLSRQVQKSADWNNPDDTQPHQDADNSD